MFFAFFRVLSIAVELRNAPWIGWIQELTPEYIWHLNLGTMYYIGDSQSSVWFYAFAQDSGWIWTSKELYPYLYSFNRGWIYQLKGTGWFYDLQTTEWFEITL